MPTFSILTISFQCARFIERCYSSIKTQSFDDWEWVVVDDGSTDDTIDILKNIQDPKIKYYQLVENVGRGKARNYGLTKIIGEWCIILDMDDLMFANRLEEANRAKNEGFDFMVSSTLLINGKYQIMGLRDVIYNQKLKLFTHATLCIKANILKEIGYSNSRRAEDQRVVLLVTNRCKGKYIQSPLYIYQEDASLNLIGAIKSNSSAFFEVFILMKSKTLDTHAQLLLYCSFFIFKYFLLQTLRFYPPLYNYLYNTRKKSYPFDNKDLKQIENTLLQFKSNSLNCRTPS